MKAHKYIVKVTKFQRPTVYCFGTAEGRPSFWVDSTHPPAGLLKVKLLKTANLSPNHEKLAKATCAL